VIRRIVGHGSTGDHCAGQRMRNRDGGTALTRRQWLRMIGMTAGSAAMYQAMSSLGVAAESTWTGPPAVGSAPPGASVLVLGAGIAGMVAAYEPARS